MVSFTILSTIGSISALFAFFAWGIIRDSFNDFVLFSPISLSSHDISTDSCDNFNKLLNYFNNLKDNLCINTHTNSGTNNTKQFINYWLCGTATEINWFDKTCHIGWDYFKGGCSIIANNDWKFSIDYWLYGTATEINWFDKSCNVALDYFQYSCTTTPIHNNTYDSSIQGLELTGKDKPNYLVSCLIYLLLACTFSYSFDILEAVYTDIDLSMYSFLCMFDFPGFTVNKRSVMTLATGLEFVVQHDWNFTTDPLDDTLRLVHLATYSLHHEYFWFEFNSLPPGWSIPSYMNLIIVPGLHWPFNYDFFQYIPIF